MGNETSVYRRNLDTIFKSHINLDEKTKSYHNRLLNSLRDEIIINLKTQSKLFQSCYTEPHYTGSYYENLRITSPEEYDVNLVLGRFKSNYIEVILLDDTYALFRLTSDRYDDYKAMKKYFLDDDRHLNARKVHNWFKGIMEKVLNIMSRSFSFESEIYDLEYSVKDRGPAYTLKVKKRNSIIFQVDLVPVFKYGEKFLVPKQPNKDYPDLNIDRLWRLSYSKKEVKILKGKSCAIKAIKVLKRLRDRMKWDPLSSYYIKTAVMHEMESQSSFDWTNGDVIEGLGRCACRLKEFISDEELPSYHDASYDLFATTLSSRTLQNIKGALGRVITKVKEDPDELFTYLCGVKGCCSLPLDEEFIEEDIERRKDNSVQKHSGDSDGFTFIDGIMFGVGLAGAGMVVAYGEHEMMHGDVKKKTEEKEDLKEKEFAEFGERLLECALGYAVTRIMEK